MTCPKDGKKLRAGVCLVCGYTAPNATMTTKQPSAGSATGAGAAGWRGRATPGSVPPPAPSSAGQSPHVPPTSAPPPVAPVPVGPHPVTGPPGSSGPSSGPRPTRGRLVVTGAISDVSPERYDTVRLGVNNALSGTAVGLLTIIPRAIGMAFVVLLSIFVPRIGGAAAGMRGRGSRRYRDDRRDSVQVPGTPFVLDGDDGCAYDCYVRGELRGGAVRLGDRVEVRGRIDGRSGVLEVQELLNVRTGARTRGYVDPSARMTGVRAALQVVVVVVLVLALLSMCGVV